MARVGAPSPSAASGVGARLVRRLRPFRGLDPLPLAVHVGRGPRLGVAEHVRVAPDDLRGDGGLDVGEVEDAGLGRELGVQDDLEPQVAELAGELGRRARLERVVHLVRLLEQVLAQRGVGLLLVPRAAVGGTQPGADRGHRPRAGDGRLGRDRGEVERGVEVRLAEVRDRGAGRRSRTGRPDGPADTPGPARRGAVRPRGPWRPGRGATDAPSSSAGAGPKHRERDDDDRTRGLERGRDEPFRGDDLEPGGGIEPEPESRLGDERVEHRGRLADRLGDGGVALDDDGLLLGVVPVGEGAAP